MSKEAMKLALVLEALGPFERLFMQADKEDLLGGQNIDCQIATTDLRKLAYATADLREALAEQTAPVQEPVAAKDWDGAEYWMPLGRKADFALAAFYLEQNKPNTTFKQQLFTRHGIHGSCF